jgi:hypothetical protein
MERICTRCSAVLEFGDQFCGECGQPSSYQPYDEPEPDPGPDRELEVESHSEPISYAEVSGEPTYDPLANPRFFWQLLRQAGIFLLIYAVADVAIGIICLLIGVAGLGIGSGLSLWWIISTLTWVGLWCAFLFMPVPALLGQHSRLLRLRATAADAVLNGVQESIVQHQTPNDSLTKRKISPPGEGPRTYVELRRGVFCGMVSSFPFGRDLYAGWTFWIYLSPFRLALMFIGRKIQDYTGRGNDLYQTLRFDSARAMIAAIHSSLAEVTEQLAPDAGSGDDLHRLVPPPSPPVRPSRARA